jgi:hypothetical protein
MGFPVKSMGGTFDFLKSNETNNIYKKAKMIDRCGFIAEQ